MLIVFSPDGATGAVMSHTSKNNYYVNILKIVWNDIIRNAVLSGGFLQELPFFHIKHDMHKVVDNNRC